MCGRTDVKIVCGKRDSVRIRSTRARAKLFYQGDTRSSNCKDTANTAVSTPATSTRAIIRFHNKRNDTNTSINDATNDRTATATATANKPG